MYQDEHCTHTDNPNACRSIEEDVKVLDALATSEAKQAQQGGAFLTRAQRTALERLLAFALDKEEARDVPSED